MDIDAITIAQVDGVVRITVDGGSRDFTPAQVWIISHELGACARQAQQHASKQQAADAGVRTSAAPEIGRRPED